PASAASMSRGAARSRSSPETAAIRGNHQLHQQSGGNRVARLRRRDQHMHRGKYRLTAGSAAIAIMAAALAAVVIPSSAGAADASVAMAGSAATPLPAGVVRLGALAPATSLTMDVTLKLGNEAGLDALVAGLANPKSAYFGRFVGKDQFGPEF